MSETDGDVPPFDPGNPQVADVARKQRIQENVFLALQIVGGQILLPALLLTVIFCKRIRRHPIFMNFCFSWIVSSVAYSLLLYRYRSVQSELSLDVPQDICLLQATFANGCQVLTACATLALVLHLWTILRKINPNKRRCFTDPNGYFELALVIFPFIPFIIFVAVTLAIGSQPVVSSGKSEPGSNLSVPAIFYCVILQNADFTESLAPGMKFFRVVIAFTIAISTIAVVFEGLVLYEILKNKQAISQLRDQSPISMFIRMAMFSFYRIVTLGFVVATLIHPDEIFITVFSKQPIYNGVIDQLQAAVPLVAFLVFGTQRDIVHVWTFWRHRDRRRDKFDILSSEKTSIVGSNSV